MRSINFHCDNGRDLDMFGSARAARRAHYDTPQRSTSSCTGRRCCEAARILVAGRATASNCCARDARIFLSIHPLCVCLSLSSVLRFWLYRSHRYSCSFEFARASQYGCVTITRSFPQRPCGAVLNPHYESASDDSGLHADRLPWSNCGTMLRLMVRTAEASMQCHSHVFPN